MILTQPSFFSCAKVLCGLLSDIDDCISVTCNNGGTCEDGINSFTCVCSYGYTGKFCDTGKQQVSVSRNHGRREVAFVSLFHGRDASTIKRATTAYNRPKKTLDTQDINRCCHEFSCLRIEFDFLLPSSIFTAGKLVTAINCKRYFFPYQ